MRSKLSIIILLLGLLLSSGCQRQPSFVEFINYTEHDFCQIQASPPHQREWGPNLLEVEAFSTGDHYRLHDLEPGMYEFRFVPCDETTYPQDYYGFILDFKGSHQPVFPLGLSPKN